MASLSDLHRPADQDLLDAVMQGKLAHVEVALARGASVDAVERRVRAHGTPLAALVRGFYTGRAARSHANQTARSHTRPLRRWTVGHTCA